MAGMIRRPFFLPVVFVVATTALAQAKEKHFEQLRVLLIADAAKCISCHEKSDGKALNDYGRELAQFGSKESLADRILRLEADAPIEAKADERKRIDKNHDVDGDGVPNWIEILCGTNPGKKDSAPSAVDADRIKSNVSCTICHISVNGPGEGIAANPHNELGKRLATTFEVKKSGPGQERRPVGKEAIAEAAERTPILTRLAMIKTKKPKGGNATFWERILLHYPTVDPKKEPSGKDVAELKREQARRKKKSARERDRGLAAKAHPLDGFLLDAKGLID